MAKKGMAPMAMSAKNIKIAADLLRLLERLEMSTEGLKNEKRDTCCGLKLMFSDHAEQSIWFDGSIDLNREMMFKVVDLTVEYVKLRLKDMGVKVS